MGTKKPKELYEASVLADEHIDRLQKAIEHLPTEEGEKFASLASFEVQLLSIDQVRRKARSLARQKQDIDTLVEISKAMLDACEPKKPRTPKMLTLTRWNNFLPSPGLRKQTAKMLADQQAHIQELESVGQFKAAKWQVACTYGLWLWYVAMRPIASVAGSIRGKVGGA